MIQGIKFSNGRIMLTKGTTKLIDGESAWAGQKRFVSTHKSNQHNEKNT